MGRGLMIEPSGLHVAFAAGTGALVFLDIVSRIILSNNKLLPVDKLYADDFCFHFYASFAKKEHAMGLELCMQLEEMNNKMGLNNFKYVLRLAEGPEIKERPARWDQKFIVDHLKDHAGKIQRVWVCGSPIMNQVFDQAFEKCKDELQLTNA